MNPTPALSSLQNSSPLLAILWAALTCGTLDIAAALVVYGHFGRPPMFLLQRDRHRRAGGAVLPRRPSNGITRPFLSFSHRILCTNHGRLEAASNNEFAFFRDE
jgi:hypothetical protein